MGILDGIVEWIAKQVMNGLDLISTSVLGALGCDMGTFLRYFPAAETMYKIFVGTAIGLVLLNWIWQLFKNFGLIAGVEAEDPFKLSIRSVLFIGLIYYCDQITDIALSIGGTPYSWILSSELPPLNFADFNSVLLTILGVCASGSVTLIALILLLILAWNYIKLLFEAAERYVLLGVVVYTAPMAFATGASQSTSNIFKSWCRMFGGQIFLLMMNQQTKVERIQSLIQANMIQGGNESFRMEDSAVAVWADMECEIRYLFMTNAILPEGVKRQGRMRFMVHSALSY